MIRRLRLWVGIAALGLASVAAPAAASEVQPADETISLSIPAGKGFEVAAILHPTRHVAVFLTKRGEAESRRGRWSGVTYAVQAPPAAFGKRIDVDFGRLGTISGHFVRHGSPRRGRNDRACTGPRPVSEAGEFRGSITIDGDGGYTRLRARTAEEYVSRSFELRCRKGHANPFKNLTPGLFGYIPAPTTSLSNHDGTFLAAGLATGSRVTEFFAIRHLDGDSDTTFKAAALEWLPEDVATTRWVEVSSGDQSSFTTTEPERHPATATVEPPSPFAGTATYSRSSHKLRGDLSVSLPGLNLPLAGKAYKAEICVLVLRTGERDCG